MEIKSDASFLRNIKCADVSAESQVDYTLPDYLGDLRGIIYSDVALRPSGRFAGGDEVEFSGIVVYNVIYVDSEGEICSAEFTSDYDYSVKCSGDSYNDSISDIRVSNYSVRVISPRKISAKASLVASVRISESDSVSVVGNALDDDATPELCKFVKKIRVSRPSATVEREFAESVSRIDGGIADEIQVVYTGSETRVESCERSESGARLAGSLKMYAIIKNGEAAYRVEKSVSFDENIPLDTDGQDTVVLPQCTVTSLRADVNADDSGCDVVMSAVMELAVIGEENQSVELTEDAFFTDFPTVNSYRDFEYTSLSEVKNEKRTHSAELVRDENDLSDIQEVLFITATPKIEESTFENGSVKLVGEVKYSGVAAKQSDEKIKYTGIKFTAPFEENVNINCQNDGKISFETEIHATSASAVLDANKMYASCIMDIKVVVCEEKSERVLESMTRIDGEEYTSNQAKITVYYPENGESLFSVAKKFRISPTKIAGDNNLSEMVSSSGSSFGSLGGVKRLIIY